MENSIIKTLVLAALTEKIRSVPGENIELVRQYLAVWTEINEGWS